MPNQYTPSTRVTLTCATCGHTFNREPSRVSPGLHFCSRRCQRDMPAEARFWRYVEKTESCWLWTGATASGYGRFSIDGTVGAAHRISWEMHRGPIPDGLFVLHNCPGGDNRACVNPDHLFLGTLEDNSADMVQKGRSSHGTRRPRAVLTDGAVRLIRDEAANGTKLRALAARFGVSNQTITKVVRRQIWQHVA